jgi:hypothetical protein
MTKIDEVMQISRRPSDPLKPRKDQPRIFADLDDTTLAERFKQVKASITMTERVDLKGFDADTEALRIRALPEPERKALRTELLRTATLLRDEFRRRMAYAVKATPEAANGWPTLVAAEV